MTQYNNNNGGYNNNNNGGSGQRQQRDTKAQIAVTGFLTSDPVSKPVGNNKVATANIAVNHKNRDDADFWTIEIFANENGSGRHDFFCDNAHKGMKVHVTGRPVINKGTKQDGTPSYFPTIKHADVELMSPLPNAGNNNNQQQQGNGYQNNQQQQQNNQQQAPNQYQQNPHQQNPYANQQQGQGGFPPNQQQGQGGFPPQQQGGFPGGAPQQGAPQQGAPQYGAPAGVGGYNR